MAHNLKKQTLSWTQFWHLSLFIFFLTYNLPSKTNFITRATKKITQKYNKAKKAATQKYENFVAENLHPQETVWDWNAIPREKTPLPATFLWASRPQTLSKKDSQKNQNSTTTNKKSDNTYYLPIDWSSIEPQEGHFNQELLRQLADLCTQLAQNKIKPIITLFESHIPQWFAEKEGFLAYENIPLYVRYAKTVFTALKATPAYWIPFLNPNEYARIKHSDDLADLLDCLEHMLIAHRDTYKELKKMPGVDRNTLIGLSKHMDPIKAWNSYNPFERHRAQKLDQALHMAYYNLINNGSMDISFSEVAKDDFIHSMTTSFDFIAITYAGQRYLQTDNSIAYHPKRDSLYAQGLYEAIKSVFQNCNKKIPILIIESNATTLQPTSFGMAQVTGQSGHRIRAIQKAYAEKFPLIGYISE